MNGNFYDPGWLALLLAVPLPVFLYWQYIQHKSPVLIVSAIAGSKPSYKRQWLSPPVVTLSLRVLTIIFVILAVADYRSVRTTRNDLPAAEADIVLALDISRSMLTEDIKPNRLEALKKVLTHFVAARSTDRFGIVMYSGESLLLCPLTKNYPFLLSKLNQLDEKAMADGTAIGLGLASAVNALRQSKSPNKIIILLTDGENNTGYIAPTTASELARRAKIKVYTIGIGSTGKAPFPVYDLNGKKTYELTETAIDEALLSDIAIHTGGSYFRAEDATGLQRIYTEIDNLQKIKKLHINLVYDFKYQYFAAIAFFFLLLEIGLRLTVYRPWML